jgi:hypothetical protein
VQLVDRPQDFLARLGGNVAGLVDDARHGLNETLASSATSRMLDGLLIAPPAVRLNVQVNVQPDSITALAEKRKKDAGILS